MFGGPIRKNEAKQSDETKYEKSLERITMKETLDETKRTPQAHSTTEEVLIVIHCRLRHWPQIEAAFNVHVQQNGLLLIQD